MKNDIWDARRIKLEEAVKASVLDLFEHMGAAGSFYLPIDSTLSIMAGPHECLDMRKRDNKRPKEES